MSDLVEVVDVRLAELPVERMTPVMAQSGVSWYLLSITLRNRSEAPMHIMTDMRRIRYDAYRRALVVHLSEPDKLAENLVFGRLSPPRYQEIEAGGEATITHSLSSPITFLETAPDGVRRSREVRLPEDIDSIDCVVAYETEKPRIDVNLAAATSREPWSQSRTTVTASWTPPEPGDLAD